MPTGNGDLSFPTDITNPVTVTFETTNIPTGNTIKLRLVPAYGTPIEAVSVAISGTTASGTASAQVSLPQGPSTLQAIAGYTVTVAMGEALSRYALNEAVERVEIIAGLKGGSSAQLITRSGKRFEVPIEVLQSVGAPG